MSRVNKVGVSHKDSGKSGPGAGTRPETLDLLRCSEELSHPPCLLHTTTDSELGQALAG